MTSLSRMQGVANFPPTLAWNTSAIFSFPSSNWISGLFIKHHVFSFSLMVASMRSWPLPIWAPGKDLIFALLMLTWVLRCKAKKSIRLWTCPLGAWPVAVLDNLQGANSVGKGESRIFTRCQRKWTANLCKKGTHSTLVLTRRNGLEKWLIGFGVTCWSLLCLFWWRLRH